MIPHEMTSLDRVLCTLGHNEPDRVPLFLLLTMHGAKEMGLSIPEYFSKAQYVAEGQRRLQEKYNHDCYYAFFYAAIETAAWGGEVVFRENGPPNAGTPFIKSLDQIEGLAPPGVKTSPALSEVLRAIGLLARDADGKVPVIGVVISPFSLPVMQMGFGPYIEMIYRRPDMFAQLMAANEAFCIEWANAQLEAGATAICYFDPVSSPAIIPREIYLETGHPVAMRTLGRINGPTATHLASGIALPVAEDIAGTGTAAIGVSSADNLAAIKEICRGKLTLIGNLNGLEMVNWTRQKVFEVVKAAISAAGAGGGFILSDNHGEIPYQVPEAVLLAISEAVQAYGRYPLKSH